MSQISQSLDAGSEARTAKRAGSRSQREGSFCDLRSAAWPQAGQIADDSPGTRDAARGCFGAEAPLLPAIRGTAQSSLLEAIGQKAVIPNPHQFVLKHVLQESAEQLHLGQGHTETDVGKAVDLTLGRCELRGLTVFSFSSGSSHHSPVR